MIQTNYDPEADVLHVGFGPEGGRSENSQEVAPGIYVEFNPKVRRSASRSQVRAGAAAAPCRTHPEGSASLWVRSLGQTTRRTSARSWLVDNKHRVSPVKR